MEREVQSLRGFLTRENLLLSSLKDITGSDMTIAQNEQLSANERNANSWADSEEGKRWTAALQVQSFLCLIAFFRSNANALFQTITNSKTCVTLVSSSGGLETSRV